MSRQRTKVYTHKCGSYLFDGYILSERGIYNKWDFYVAYAWCSDTGARLVRRKS